MRQYELIAQFAPEVSTSDSAYALAGNFFSTRTFSNVTNFGKPFSIGYFTSPSISGRAYSTNFSLGRKPSSVNQSRGIRCSTLAISCNGCRSVVHLYGLLCRRTTGLQPLQDIANVEHLIPRD